MVTVIGPAGRGVRQRLRPCRARGARGGPSSADGVWLADLAGISDPDPARGPPSPPCSACLDEG